LPGGRLVYGRFDSRGVTPFTSNTDGTDERQLLPPDAELPAWAPNGLLISVVGHSPQGLVAAGTVKPDGSDFVQFDSPEAGLDLGCNIWSPDGARLACEGFGETDPTLNGLYTVSSTDGGDLTRVTTSPDGQHDLPGSYSVDGSQIIFGRADPEDLDHGTLMVVNLDGTDEHSLTNEPLGAGTVSPDGTTILSGTDGTLFTVPFAGGQPSPIRIQDAPNDVAFGATWSPDGQWIVFTLHPRSAPHSDIYIMRRDGTDLRQVTRTPNQDEEFAGWQPTPQAGGVTMLEVGCTNDLARCQDMAAGTYETSGTSAFLPGLTVTLPQGWSSAEQDAGEFMLHQASDAEQANAIFFWRDLVPWVDGAARPELGTSADEFADYLLGDARLAVVEGPTRTFRVRGPDSLETVGAVTARSLSVIVSDSAQTDPDLASDCPAGTCVNLFIDPDHWPGPANLGRNIDAPAAGCPCGQAWRLYVASIGGEPDSHMFVVAVETVGPNPLRALSEWEAEVDPIIASVLVPSIVVNN
jgi:hypothetical protein